MLVVVAATEALSLLNGKTAELLLKALDVSHHAGTKITCGRQERKKKTRGDNENSGKMANLKRASVWPIFHNHHILHNLLGCAAAEIKQAEADCGSHLRSLPSQVVQNKHPDWELLSGTSTADRNDTRKSCMYVFDGGQKIPK